MKVVLDTNVLVSGFVRPEPAPGQLLAAWREDTFTLIVSEHILTEAARTFEETPYFRKHLDDKHRKQNIALLRAEAVIVKPVENVTGIATHPEDDLVLAAALAAQADYLITGDKKLLNVGIYRGTHLLSPRTFLNEVLKTLKDAA
jgi:putative PIN family toxin of toxin-antitoxin system